MFEFVVTALRTLNELLTAGIAITAFSLLFYALSFNLRDRVARSFAIIMSCVVIVFVSEALSSVAPSAAKLEFWMKLQWVGIIFLPAAYLHLSDALLSTTGKPSRGRRRLAVQLMYLIAGGFLMALPFSLLVGPLVQDAQPSPHLQRTPLTWVFTVFYITAMLVSWNNFWRSYKRTMTSASHRRMAYLITGSLAPALGSYPYLLFGSSFAAQHPLFFWLAVTLSNLLVSVLIILMAYAVAFFGVPWPDRVVKRRLLKWLMRGPVTASSVLAITTLARRSGTWFGLDTSGAVLVVMVASILVMEHLITFAAPVWERWLFSRKDRAEIELLQTLDERLLTLGDLQQFLEAVLTAIGDRLQSPKAFLASLGAQNGDHDSLELLVTIGGDEALGDENLSANLLEAVAQKGKSKELFSWGDYWLMPLYDQEEAQHRMLGLLGVTQKPAATLDIMEDEAITILAERAALALRDRYRQQQAFNSLQELTPQMSMIQQLRAAARYDSAEILSNPTFSLEEVDLASWVKEALTHYWGGPKLTESPLLELQVVQQAAKEQRESPTNALRSILRMAIEHIRPTGERRFTAEWILYNILEMKFLEGRKVREVAMRLAMSEADLYRKQRVAIEAVARAIVEMEVQARRDFSHAESVPVLENKLFY